MMENEKHQLERLIFRMIMPLDVILMSIEETLGETLGSVSQAERESDFLLSSLPRIDRQTLDQGQECPICAKLFNSRAKNSFTRTVTPIPLQLPCSHIVCENCLETWLSKAGSCPMCRCTLTSRVFQGGDSVVDVLSEVRAVFRKVLHFGQLYLETNPSNDSFGGMWLWGRKAESEEQRRAWTTMQQFQSYKTRIETKMLSTKGGKAILAQLLKDCGAESIYPRRAQRLDQNENMSVAIANAVLETREVVGAEHEWGESEAVYNSEDAWETDWSEIIEYEMN